MGIPQNRALRRGIHVAFLGTAVFIVVAAWACFAWIGRNAANAAADSVATRFDTLRAELADFGRASQRFEIEDWAASRSTGPYVALIAVYDEQGQPVTIAASNVGVRRALTKLWIEPPERSAGVRRLTLANGQTAPILYRFGTVRRQFAAHPHRSLLLVEYADRVLVGAWSRQAWAGFYVPVSILGLLAVAVTLTRLNREILTPMSRLVNAADKALEDGKSRKNASSDNPLSGLADAVEGLGTQKEQWREQANNLKLNVERRVDAKTRQIARQLRNAFRDAATDPLTGLGNRRALEERLGTLIQEALRIEADFSLVLLDIDSFKTVNDKHGHAAGDELLRFVGELLSGSLRDDDVAVRMGGDEFVLLLPGIGPSEASGIVQRIAGLFRQRGAAFDVQPQVSMSAGIVSLRIHPTQDPNEFLECADRALYAAKEHGRDAIRIYSPSMSRRTAST